MKRLTVVSVVVLVVFLAALGVKAAEPKWCPLCSMNLKMYWKTNHRLTLADGTQVQTCSLHCAAQVYADKSGEIVKWEVVDYQTQAFVEAKEALFLIKSSLPGTMTAVSKLAFGSRAEAARYQKEHGGTIGTFDEALEQALADLGEDKKMLMKKMALMSKKGQALAEKYGCYQCHGEGGKGGRAPAWDAPAFVQKMNSRVKIKEAITGGTDQMPAFGEKIPEAELHALTIYVWSRRTK